jgi:phytoene synthase
MRLESWENRLITLAYAPLEDWTSEHTYSPEDSPTLDLAYSTCEEITAEHSATFHLASSLLAGEQKRAMRALYAFCRVSDDLIDKSQGLGDPGISEVTRFELWRQLSLSDNPPQDNLVAAAWTDTRLRFNIPCQYAEQLLDGVARDLEVSRYDTFTELAGYCYSVASTVGLMSMHIVGYKDKSAIPYAVKLGVALQLTNILRDVARDWQIGRLYLPQEELAAFNITEADIAAGNNDHRWHAFMTFQIARARQLYDEAMPGLVLLERRGRVAVAAAAELYRAILDDIEAHNYDVFTRRAYISNRRKVLRIPGIWWRSVTMNF